jgi:hypothetical protein
MSHLNLPERIHEKELSVTFDYEDLILRERKDHFNATLTFALPKEVERNKYSSPSLDYHYTDLIKRKCIIDKVISTVNKVLFP